VSAQADALCEQNDTYNLHVWLWIVDDNWDASVLPELSDNEKTVAMREFTKMRKEAECGPSVHDYCVNPGPVSGEGQTDRFRFHLLMQCDGPAAQQYWNLAHCGKGAPLTACHYKLERFRRLLVEYAATHGGVDRRLVSNSLATNEHRRLAHMESELAANFLSGVVYHPPSKNKIYNNVPVFAQDYCVFHGLRLGVPFDAKNVTPGMFNDLVNDEASHICLNNLLGFRLLVYKGQLQRVLLEQSIPDPSDLANQTDGGHSVESGTPQPPPKKAKKTRLPKGIVLSMLEVHGVPYQPAGRMKQQQNYAVPLLQFYYLLKCLYYTTGDANGSNRTLLETLIPDYRGFCAMTDDSYSNERFRSCLNSRKQIRRR
jgi:hypothetical protein